jgi:hypothetical protein
LWAGWTPTSSPYLARGCAPSFGWVFFDRFSPRANILYCSCAQQPPVDNHSEPQFVSNWYSVLPTSYSSLFLWLLAGMEPRVQVDLATNTVNNRLELVQRLLRRHDLFIRSRITRVTSFTNRNYPPHWKIEHSSSIKWYQITGWSVSFIPLVWELFIVPTSTGKTTKNQVRTLSPHL